MTPPLKSTIPAPAPVAHVKRSPNAVRPQTAEERRRAQRVLLRMQILVHLPGKANPASWRDAYGQREWRDDYSAGRIIAGHQADHRESEDTEKSGSARGASAATQRGRFADTRRVHRRQPKLLEYFLSTKSSGKLMLKLLQYRVLRFNPLLQVEGYGRSGGSESCLSVHENCVEPV